MIHYSNPKPIGFYVYAHYLGDKQVYIGKGKDGRVLEDYNRPDYDWDSYQILWDNLTGTEAHELEATLIGLVGLENLANNCIGTATMKGKKHTEEAKAKIGKFHKGKPKSEEHKRKISEALKKKQL